MAGENRILRHCRQAPAGSAARERRQDMSEKADRFRDYDITTRAVHTGNDYDKETGLMSSETAEMRVVEAIRRTVRPSFRE